MQTYPNDPVIHENITPDFSRTITYLENLMVVRCDFTNGPMKTAEPFHSHKHEQITYVAEGELMFYKGQSEYHLKKGDLISIPSGIPHCIKTLSGGVRLIDSFTPLRKDFLKTEGGIL